MHRCGELDRNHTIILGSYGSPLFLHHVKLIIGEIIIHYVFVEFPKTKQKSIHGYTRLYTILWCNSLIQFFITEENITRVYTIKFPSYSLTKTVTHNVFLANVSCIHVFFFIIKRSIRNWGYKGQKFKKLKGYIALTLRNWSVTISHYVAIDVLYRNWRTTSQNWRDMSQFDVVH